MRTWAKKLRAAVEDYIERLKYLSRTEFRNDVSQGFDLLTDRPVEIVRGALGDG